ncbi:hypothetical protein Q5E84_03325, partial [Providencia sp. CRE-138-0026]
AVRVQVPPWAPSKLNWGYSLSLTFNHLEVVFLYLNFGLTKLVLRNALTAQPFFASHSYITHQKKAHGYAM